jgi:hypothetical protein
MKSTSQPVDWDFQNLNPLIFKIANFPNNQSIPVKLIIQVFNHLVLNQN